MWFVFLLLVLLICALYECSMDKNDVKGPIISYMFSVFKRIYTYVKEKIKEIKG